MRLILLSALLLTTAGCYGTWAKRRLERDMGAAAREPDGVHLLGGGPVRIDRGRARACLLLHGFPSTPADFGDLPAALDAAGWDVYAPLMPGFGTDPRNLVGVTSEDIVAAASNALAALRGRYERVVVCGFSMGGAVATILSARGEGDALVLVNPLYRVRHHLPYVLPLRWWHTMGRLFTYYVVQPSYLIHLNREEGRARTVAYRVLPGSAITQLFRTGDAGRKAVPADVPILMLLSQGDGVISARTARARFAAFPAGDKTLVVYARSDHVLFLDHDREAATEEIVRFLARVGD